MHLHMCTVNMRFDLTHKLYGKPSDALNTQIFPDRCVPLNFTKLAHVSEIHNQLNILKF